MELRPSESRVGIHELRAIAVRAMLCRHSRGSRFHVANNGHSHFAWGCSQFREAAGSGVLVPWRQRRGMTSGHRSCMTVQGLMSMPLSMPSVPATLPAAFARIVTNARFMW